MAAVLVEVLRDGIGSPAYRVSRIFPSAASAEAGMRALANVVPEAFEPVGPNPQQRAALEALTAQAEELGLYGLPAEAQDLAIPEPHPLAVRTFDNAMDTDGEDAPCVGSVCRSE